MNPSKPLFTDTVAAAGALAAHRFITQAGAYPSAGAAAYGVTRTSADAAGDLVPTDVLGTTIVEAGAEVTKDTHLMVDNTGRVVPLTVGTKFCVAKAMQAASGAGVLLEVLLVPTNGIATAAS